MSVALAAPDVSGLKVTVYEVLWPAGIVVGSDRPPTLKAELLVLASVTVTLAPLAVRLPDAVPLVPVTTFPRPKVVGFTLSCPVDDVIPVPDSAIVPVGLEASDVTVAVALNGPAAFGVNVMLSVALCPAPIEAGMLGAVTVKYLLEIVALLIETDVVPEFVAVTVKVLLVFAVTLPKSRLRLPRESVPFCC